MTNLHQKFYSESKGLTEAAIRRLAQIGGAYKMSKDVYTEGRESAVVFLEEILFRAYVYNDFLQKKDTNAHKLDTISVILALRSSKYNIKYIAGVPMDKHGKLIKLHVGMHGGAGKKSSQQKPSSQHLANLRQAKKRIRAMQESTNLAIPKAPFERLVREIIQILLDKDAKQIIITPGALTVLQQALESYLIKTFEKSVMQGIHAGRKTLFAKDIRLIRHIKGERTFPM